VAQGQGARVQAVLLRRFREDRRGLGSLQEAGGRTAAELREAAESLRDARLRAAARRRARDEARRAQQAAAAYERRLDELALRQEQAWQQVDELIVTKRPRDYDEALEVLGGCGRISGAAVCSVANATDRIFRRSSSLVPPQIPAD